MDIENKTTGEPLDLENRLGIYNPELDLSSYQYPVLDLLKNYDSSINIDAKTLDINKKKIVETLNYSQIEIDAISAIIGPLHTLYEIIPAPGVRVSKIKSLRDDLSMNLAAEINITGPIPGKGSMGIAIPHSTPELVSIRSVLATEKFQECVFDLPIAMGRTMNNEVFLADLAKLPHLLIAGATGQGKSVCLTAILLSLLYKKHPSQLKFVLIDTNSLELGLFRKIERHFLAKMQYETDAIVSDKLKAVNTLNSLAIELDQRYDLLKLAGARQIKEYNQKFIDRKLNPNNGHHFLPFIVVVIDEYAELLTENKEIELVISRLAQLGRAAGIHLIISTQRPSVNIITGTIKANFTARLAFRVTSAIDSRTILDNSGAEFLKGHGDMLLLTGAETTHLMGAYVDTEEVISVNEYIGNQRGYSEAFQLPQYGAMNIPAIHFDHDDIDSMFEDAARIVVMQQQGSISLIQRKLKLGYNRAARIIDQLAAAGVLGPFDGSKVREVNLPDDYALEIFLQSLSLTTSSPIVPKVNKIVSVQVETKITENSLTDPIILPQHPIQHEPIKIGTKTTHIVPVPPHLIKQDFDQTKMESKRTDSTAIPALTVDVKSKSNKKSFWDWLFK